MSQTTFTEKEIKQVFDALLQERKRVEELIAENAALCAQGQQLKRMLKEEKEHRQQDCQQQARALLQIQALKEAKEAELVALHTQWQIDCHMHTEDMHLLQQAAVCKLEQQTENQHAEDTRLQQVEEAFKSKISAVEGRLAAIYSTLASAAKESKVIEMRYLKAVEEKMHALNQVQQLHGQVEKLRAESQDSRRKLQKHIAETHVARQQDDEALKEQQDRLVQSETCQRQAIEQLVNQSEQWSSERCALQLHIEALQKETTKLAEEKVAAQLECTALLTKVADSQDQLDSATQHIAKKIREVALLQLHTEELEAELATRTHEIETCQNQKQLLQEEIEQQKQAAATWQQRLEHMQQESLAWQEKLNQSEAERLHCEQQLQHFQELESKHVQLEQLFSGFGSILKNSVQIKTERPGQNLFDLPAVQHRTRTHLFE